MNNKISIIIVSYNSFPEIFECLDSIYNNLKNLEFEIILVDNNSSNVEYRSDLNIYSNNNTNLHLISLTSNVGFSRGCNIGAANARGSHLFFVNPDIEFGNNSSLMIKKMYDICYKDLTIGAISPLLKKLDGKIDINFRYSINPINLIFGRIKKYFGRKNENYFISNNVTSIAGAALFIPIKYFNLISGFDTRYFMYGDDIQLSYDLKSYGLNLYILNEFTLLHKLGTSSVKRPILTLFALYSSIVKFYLFQIKNWIINIIIKIFISPLVLTEYLIRLFFSKSKKISN
jgi:GT2 family glycosyltransferase